MAFIPNTTTFVSINNVNADVNSAYFVANYDGANLARGYNGLTNKIATASVVVSKG